MDRLLAKFRKLKVDARAAEVDELLDKKRLAERDFTTILSALRRQRKLPLVLRVGDWLMRQPGASLPNVKHFNVMLAAAADAGNLFAAKKLFKLMDDRQVLPSTQSYASAVRACESSGQKEAAFAFAADFEERTKNGKLAQDGVGGELLAQGDPARAMGAVEGAPFVYSALMRCCVKVGAWRSALDVMGRMRLLQVPRDQHCFTAALEAWRQGREPDAAAAELQRMHEELGPGPNAVAYSIAMGCCVRAGQWKRTLQLFESHMERRAAASGDASAADPTALDAAAAEPSAPPEPPPSAAAPKAAAAPEAEPAPEDAVPESALEPAAEASPAQGGVSVSAAKQLSWEELDATHRAAAETLGWDGPGWDEGLTTEACEKPWGGLDEAELAAARLLGYSEEEWNAELEGDESAASGSDGGGAAAAPAAAAPAAASTAAASTAAAALEEGATPEDLSAEWEAAAEEWGEEGGEESGGASDVDDFYLGAGEGEGAAAGGGASAPPPRAPPATKKGEAKAQARAEASRRYANYAATALTSDKGESYCYAAALAACKLGKQWEQAQAMLSALPADSPARANPFLWEHGVLAASAARKHAVVLELYEEAKNTCSPSDKSLACALRAYGWLHEPSSAVALHELHLASANGVTVGALLFALQLNGEHVQLLECYDRYGSAAAASEDPACVDLALQAAAQVVRQARASDADEESAALPAAASRAARAAVGVANELKLKIPKELEDAVP